MPPDLDCDIPVEVSTTGQILTLCRPRSRLRQTLALCRPRSRPQPGAPLLHMDVIWLVHLSLVLLLAGVARPSRPSPLHRQQQVYDTATQDILTGFKRIRPRYHPNEVHVISETTDDEDLVVEAGSGMELTGSSDRKDLENTIQGVAVKLDCCDVGRMTAVNGLRCDAQFHAAMLQRLREPQTSRRHHRPLVDYRHLLNLPLKSFSVCVTSMPLEFYKCCEAAKTRQYEARMWQRVPKHRARAAFRHHRYDRHPYMRG